MDPVGARLAGEGFLGVRALFSKIVDYNLDVVTRAVADVLNEMSEKQRQRAMKEIESLRSKIRKLIGNQKLPGPH